MAINVPLKYDLGLMAGSYAMPDPSEFTLNLADLDTEAHRDTTGELHRNRVAQKLTADYSWNVLPWNVGVALLSAVSGDSFMHVCPDPRNLASPFTAKCYVSDRKIRVVYMLDGQKNNAMLNVSLSIIEF